MISNTVCDVLSNLSADRQPPAAPQHQMTHNDDTLFNFSLTQTRQTNNTCSSLGQGY